MMITEITCSILESQCTSDDDGVNADSSKPTRFEPTIKHSLRERRLDRRIAHNLVMRGHKIGVKISIMENLPLKAISGRSRCNTITKLLREEIFEWILSHTNVKTFCVSSYLVNVLNPQSN